MCVTRSGTRYMIQSVTFDFGSTIAIDDSDELKRAQMGLPSKAEARIQLFVDHAPPLSARTR